MISRIHVSTILLLAALIWGILLMVVSGVAVSISWMRYLSMVTGALLVLLSAFDRWLWRLPILQGWFVKRPNIHGTWRTMVRSKWVDPSTGEGIEPIEGYIAIRQTYSLLSLRLVTSESSSELIGSDIVSFPDGTFRIVGVYRNEPKQLIRDRSPIHNGAILLQIVGRPAAALKGHYWTDRNTSGEIELTNRHSRIYQDFETASHAFRSEHA